jgi:hypothetical protein
MDVPISLRDGFRITGCFGIHGPSGLEASWLVRKVSVVSLAVAISGLNSIRHTLDSLARLAGYDRAIGSQRTLTCQIWLNASLKGLTMNPS